MKYLLFESGKTELDLKKLEEFYRPYYAYTKKKKFPEGISPDELSNAVEKIIATPERFIGLGIFFNEVENWRDYDSTPHEINITNIHFSAIKKNDSSIFNHEQDFLYILATDSLLKIQSNNMLIERYDFAQLSDGRWVFYLLTHRESHMPTRIPSE